MDTTPVIVAARRTPIGSAGHALRELTLIDLAAPVIVAVLSDLDLAGERVDDVVLGVARGPGGNPARVAALDAGLPVSVPGVSVDRQCGSGLAAITLASDMVRSGAATVILAGGAESGSRAEPGRAAFAPEWIGDPGMGEAADALAEHLGITRARQDAYARRSHERALASRDHVAAELVDIGVLAQDQRPRELSAQSLARMPAAFTPGGTVTAGNACGVSDGAAIVAIVPEWWRAERGIPGLTVRSHSTVGVSPLLPGLGPEPAIRRVIADAQLSVSDIDVLEITEAFASVLLATTDSLGLDALGSDAERICPLGGAIALGHPWGASGAILMVRLFTELVRMRRGTRGVAACAVGGGMGIATLVERVG